MAAEFGRTVPLFWGVESRDNAARAHLNDDQNCGLVPVEGVQVSANPRAETNPPTAKRLLSSADDFEHPVCLCFLLP